METQVFVTEVIEDIRKLRAFAENPENWIAQGGVLDTGKHSIRIGDIEGPCWIVTYFVTILQTGDVFKSLLIGACYCDACRSQGGPNVCPPGQSIAYGAVFGMGQLVKAGPIHIEGLGHPVVHLMSQHQTELSKEIPS